MKIKYLSYLALILSVLLPPAGILIGLIALHYKEENHIAQLAILIGTIIMTSVIITLLL